MPSIITCEVSQGKHQEYLLDKDFNLSSEQKCRFGNPAMGYFQPGQKYVMF